MPKTFNRKPITVNTPSSPLKAELFMQSNFKGLDCNKNFLTVDQETFSACKNVYVDSTSLLRSRPSLMKHAGYNTVNGILEFWDFADVEVYRLKDSLTSKEFLVFVNTSKPGTDAYKFEITGEVKLILVERKVFIFAKDSFNYYDCDTHTVSTAENFIYIPVKTAVFNSEETEIESLNELTNKYYVNYLFENFDSLDYNELIGDTVKITIDGVTTSVVFKENTQYVLVGKVRNFEERFYLNGEPTLSISDVNSAIMSYVNGNSTLVYYTSDFVHWSTLTVVSDLITYPRISKYGDVIIGLKSDGVYMYPLTVYSELDETWTNVIQKNNESWYNSNLSNLIFDSNSAFYAYDYEHYAATCYRNIRGLYYLYIVKCDGNVYSCDTCFDNEEITELSSKFKMTYNRMDSIGNIYYSSTGSSASSKLTTDAHSKIETTCTITVSTMSAIQKGANNAEFVFDLELSIQINNKTYSRLNKKHYEFKVSKSSSTEIFEFKDSLNNGVSFKASFGTLEGNAVAYLEPIYDFSASCKYAASGALSPSPTYMKLVKVVNSYVPVLFFKDSVYVHKYKNERTISIALPDNTTLHEHNLNDVILYNDDVYIILNSGNAEVPHKLLKTKYDGISNQYVYSLPKVSSDYPAKFLFDDNYAYLSTNSYMLFTNNYEVLESKIDYIKCGVPIKFAYATESAGLIIIADGAIYSSNDSEKVIELSKLYGSGNNYILPTHVAELDNFYLSVGKTLYISDYPSDGNFKWYFPKINTEELDYNITNLHPISDSEMGIFLDRGVHYIKKQDSAYYRFKSKIEVSCKEGSDIISTYDGKYTVFATDRGLAAMSYENFVASTEQTVTYFTDSILDEFKKISAKPVKLYKNEFWIYCYNKEGNNVLLLDLRNNSWWPLQYFSKITSFLDVDRKMAVLSEGQLCDLNMSDYNYYDIVGTDKYAVDWSITSQKLHFNCPNFLKNIEEIVLMSTLDTSNGSKSIYYKLNVICYRKYRNFINFNQHSFNVDDIRTFVKYINFVNVNEFTYTLTSHTEYNNNGIIINPPLSLSSITLKYKVTGKVR